MTMRYLYAAIIAIAITYVGYWIFIDLTGKNTDSVPTPSAQGHSSFPMLPGKG